MRIVVNDSSALIDLKKGGLLEVFVELPFELVISDALLADELLSFTKSEVHLMRRHMTVASLDGEEMVAVAEAQATSPALSFHDCISLIIAKREAGCILLTGDKRLRSKATTENVECHGVLWAIEEIAKAKLASNRTLIRALERWKEDQTVRLPVSEIELLIARLQ